MEPTKTYYDLCIALGQVLKNTKSPANEQLDALLAGIAIVIEHNFEKEQRQAQANKTAVKLMRLVAEVQR